MRSAAVASTIKICALICLVLLSSLFAVPAQAATRTGALNSGQYAYYDITLPNPQQGMRLVLSTSATSTVYLYTGTSHTSGTLIAASYSQTLHTLLVAPGSLTAGGSYHVRILASGNLSYSFTDDLSYVRELGWDNGSATTSTAQPDTAGGDYLFKITCQTPADPAWSNILKVTSGEADIFLQQGTPPLTRGSYSSTKVGTDAVYLDAGPSLAGQEWYIRVHATPGATWQLTSGDLQVRTLTWDKGLDLDGTDRISQAGSDDGDYFFKITSQTAAYGAWRTVLNVGLGEASLYMQRGEVPFGDTTYQSVNPGSEGIILGASQFSDNEVWYIRVHSTAGSNWNIFSGDIYAHDLGTVSDAGVSATVRIGPEGTYFFKSAVEADTKAWRIWLNGSSDPLYVAKGRAPVKSVWLEDAEQSETGQALLVPPYLSNGVYLVGVRGINGEMVTIDSGKQRIVTPSTAAGYAAGGGHSNFDFTLSNQGSAGKFGYLTYRIDVPIQQIAWQVNVTPGSSGVNPEVYVRKGDVPNRWQNDAFSEAPAGVTDSITQVPPTLTDGTWYVTVYGSGDYSFTLSSKNPVITGATFINTSDPDPVPAGYAYPYKTVPLANGSQFFKQSGWRYYQVSDINSQLGFLGWELDLANQVAGSEIALRRNAVPARWSYRSGGSSYSPGVQEASHVDLSSTNGILQQPGHQADIWYVGVYTRDAALGAFALTTRDIPAPLQVFAQGSVARSNQDPATWQWFKYTIPADAEGWDLRLKVTAGSPQMVVRRDQLPTTFSTSSSSCGGPVYTCDSWMSGAQWPAWAGDDWTSRSYLSWAPSYTADKNGYLIMGMGSPLEAGTYYVGVGPSRNDGIALSYTVQSRGIGLAGSNYPIQIQDLPFAGGVASGSALAPREVAWYRVSVPEGSDSWSLNLAPTQGEAMLAIRHGVLPNVMSFASTADAGTKRQKSGAEYYYRYPQEGGATIAAGDYYLAVISEGENPMNDALIGSGSVNYTLTSVGTVGVEDNPAPVAAKSVVSWKGQGVDYGAEKVYRFHVPAGLSSMEVRLNKGRSGNAIMAIRQDAAGAGRIPDTAYYGSYHYLAHEGGAAPAWSNIDFPAGRSIVTIGSPAAGDYTVTVVASSLQTDLGMTYPDAGFDLEVEGMGTTELPFANGSQSVTGQDPQAWRYFKVEVPADAKGWDLRLKVSAGNPTMVLRREDLPSTFMTSTSGCGGPIYSCNSWSSGAQWPADPGFDWTGRTLTAPPANSADRNGYLIMGMGSPLEPGTYYVGVGHNGSDSALMSYTLESRGIGLAGSNYPIQVRDLPYAGGAASVTALAAREVAWYRVTVPEGAESWSLNLAPAQGEAMLAIRQGVLPNVALASSSTSYGTKRQKGGNEYFYSYVQDGAATIVPGEYYLAVISEGEAPLNSASIGNGGVSYTLTSVGRMPVAEKTAPVAAGSVLSWREETIPYGAQKVYRFHVPDGLSSLEIRLNKERKGNAIMAVRRDASGAARIPGALSDNLYSAHEGGDVYHWENVGYPLGRNVVTIGSPAAGDYTVTVVANSIWAEDVGTTFPDALFDLEVEGMGTLDLPFANGSRSVSGQDPQSWRYFKVEVPDDAKGWDLRLKVSSGSPAMVLRRGELPSSFTPSGNTACGGAVYNCNSWLEGAQWPASPGTDWTGRSYLPGSNIADPNSWLIMGMNSPLQPGTYYVGVSQNGSDTTPLSYTLESRGIGLAHSNYPIQIHDLPYAGGVASGTGLAPREVAWYRVTVPQGAQSWSLNMAPTTGEAMLAIREGALPNVAAFNRSTYQGARRQKNGTEYFYSYAEDNIPTITPGEYYVAVISEGENLSTSNNIGTGSVSYTLTSVGRMPVAESPTPVAGDAVVTWSGQKLAYAAQKVYRFHVPATAQRSGIEIRLKNKVGNPLLAVRRDEAGAAQIPYAASSLIRSSEGGASYQWTNQIYANGSDVVTIATPLAGDYTITVVADYLVGQDNMLSYPEAAYDLQVGAITPAAMPFVTSEALTGHLIDQQVNYFEVQVPEEVNGFKIAGWKIRATSTAGAASLRVAREGVPGGSMPTLAASGPVTIVAPPYLSPGTWYIEVKGDGITDYALTSDIISADPEKHRRSWNMPDGNNRQGGVPFGYPAGLSAPEIGDSGLDRFGNAIINDNTGDQGTDLAENDWHFYRVVVPDNNGGHLRTIVEALNGRPELYLRAGSAPSPYHRESATDPNAVTVPMAYDRAQAVSGTMYGNWVPLDRRTEAQLTPGDWWIGIRGADSNVRYRLKLAAGNVRDEKGAVDSAALESRLFQDLDQASGSYTGQTLAAGNMRYYRVTVPGSSTTLGSSTPLEWKLTLQQQVGDVAILLRDSVPPGQGEDGNAANSPSSGAVTGSGSFRDWFDDQGEGYPRESFVVIDESTTHTLTLPPLRPGATYYLGVYAKSDAVFDLSSAIGSDRLKLDGVIPFADGSASATLAPGEKRLYRIDVPADALVWHHFALHADGIRMSLEEGTVPRQEYQLWYSSGDSNVSETRELWQYPWQPGHSYYLMVENAGAGVLPFTFTMGGKTTKSRLTVSVTGSCPGSSVATTPYDLSCTGGACSVEVIPYSSLTLVAYPGDGCQAAVSGACSGNCTLEMASAAAVNVAFSDIAAPSISDFHMTNSSRSTVPVTLSARDNTAVVGFCVSESRTHAGCSWSAAAPASYTFTGLPNNTATGRTLYAYARDAAGNIGSATTYLEITVSELPLTVKLGGTGSGSVNSSPSGIACTSGNCSGYFAADGPVTLLQTPRSGSLFKGWSGDCTGTGACTVTMDAAKSVTATFDSLPPVRIAGATPVYYSTLQAAYDAAKSGDVIQLKEGALAGSLKANRSVSVIVRGGYDASYTSRIGGTVIGRATVQLGKVVFDKVKVK